MPANPPCHPTRADTEGGSTAAARLKRVDIRRAVRDGGLSVWSNDVGRAISASAVWAVYRHWDFGDWIFIHRATGLQAPALYAKTLKAAAPVLAALEPSGRFVRADEPGDAGPPAAMKLMKEEIRGALSRCDTCGLDPAWSHYALPLQTPPHPEVGEATHPGAEQGAQKRRRR